MYLTNLEIKGLKGGVSSYDAGSSFTFMFGENGTGKTTVLQALQLLLRGKTYRSIGVASTGKDIALLSRKGNISIKGTWDDNGKQVWVKRTWMRTESGSVSEKIQQNINPNITNTKEQQGLLNLYFGVFPEAWEPEAFLSLSAEKMRSKLLSSVSEKPISDVLGELAPIIGNDLPAWAKPGSMDMTVETWLDFAKKETKQKLNEARAEIRLCKQNLGEEMEFIAHRPEAVVKSELEAINKQKEKLLEAQQAKNFLSYLCGKKEKLQEDLNKIEEEIAVAREAAQASEQAKTEQLESIKTKESELMDELKKIGAASELEAQQDDLRERILAATEEAEEYKELQTRLRKSQEHLLQQVKTGFEQAVSAVSDSPCVVNIDDGKCRITINGVDISGMSDGETLSLLPGIIAGLAATTESKWIPLLVDRFEAVSKSRRVPFLKALQQLIDSGKVSQAFIAGCPDEQPATPENSKVYTFTK